MAELDFTVRTVLADMNADVALPAMYDALSVEQRRKVRSQYAQLQDGLCWHCKCPLAGPPHPSVSERPLDMSAMPPNFLAWAHHLHHDHRTGLTLGTVHAYCNGVLWQYYGE